MGTKTNGDEAMKKYLKSELNECTIDLISQRWPGKEGRDAIESIISCLKGMDASVEDLVNYLPALDGLNQLFLQRYALDGGQIELADKIEQARLTINIGKMKALKDAVNNGKGEEFIGGLGGLIEKVDLAVALKQAWEFNQMPMENPEPLIEMLDKSAEADVAKLDRERQRARADRVGEGPQIK